MSIDSLIIKAILERLSEFKNHKNYILQIKEHAAIGYALDRSPGWIYIWKLMVPLYDIFPCLHLSLGNRIGKVARSHSPTMERNVEMIKEATEIVEANLIDKQFGDLEDIATYLSGSEVLYHQKLLSFTNIYLGRNDTATERCLEDLSNIFLQYPAQLSLNGSGEILDLLRTDYTLAKEKLIEWEIHNKLKLS
jgi:hypothetical protein